MAINFWKRNKKPEVETPEETKERAATAAPAKGTPKAASSTGDSKNAPQVLLRPMLTEKSTRAGVYYFQIPISANRAEVKKAVKSVYGVTPEKVNIINRLGKKVTFGGRGGSRSDWKRAIVMLKKGESISVE
ncbi:MAG: 50S ribosomal protein L23 [Patescibacteria group bacterium]